MTKRQAHTRRKELENEIRAASVAASEASREFGVATAAAEELTRERRTVLADAARGQDGAAARAEELERTIAAEQATASRARERADAAGVGRSSAQDELKRLIHANRSTFLDGARKLADQADADLAKAISALEVAQASRQAARGEFGVISGAMRTIAHESLGMEPDPEAIHNLIEDARRVVRPEPTTPAKARPDPNAPITVGNV